MKRRTILSLAAVALLCATLASAAAQDPAPHSDDVGRISLDEFKALMASGRPVTVIDVRGGATEGIKGAVNIPLNQLEARLSEVPQDREIVTYCA